MTWADALERFGTDKPDLRFGMELVDLSAEFEKTEVRAFSGSHLKALCVPGGASFTRSRIDALGEQAKRAGAAGLAWFRVTAAEDASERAGGEALALDSPLNRFLTDTERIDLLEKTEASEGDLILAVSDTHRVACTTLGALRVALGSPPVGQGPHRYVWVVDFPMFDGVDASGNPQPAHHPFTMPYEDDLALLETVPFAVRSQAYDLVLNGWELGSGSVRIHRRDIQSKIFDTLGISKEEAESRFGFLLERVPLRSAAPCRLRVRHRPPDGGAGGGGEHPGSDRLPQDAIGGGPPHRCPQCATRLRSSRARDTDGDPAHVDVDVDVVS